MLFESNNYNASMARLYTQRKCAHLPPIMFQLVFWRHCYNNTIDLKMASHDFPDKVTFSLNVHTPK